VYQQLHPILTSLGSDFNQRFKMYFSEDEQVIERRILSAAHFYATKWEFDILERADPHAYEMETIRKRLEEVQSQYEDLEGVRQLKGVISYKSFVDLCGQLRFQLRWANIHRVPRTSVLGHSLFVAILSYFLTLTIDGCPKRCSNNFFTGLFHDLPEVLTRDIISPVKRSIAGLEQLIKEYEKEMMEKEVYSLIPAKFHTEIRMFTESEFENVVLVDGARKLVTSEEITARYNNDAFHPRDGELVKAADRLAAFVEAYVAIRNGSGSPELQEAIWFMKNNYSRVTAAGIDFQEIYADFE